MSMKLKMEFFMKRRQREAREMSGSGTRVESEGSSRVGRMGWRLQPPVRELNK